MSEYRKLPTYPSVTCSWPYTVYKVCLIGDGEKNENRLGLQLDYCEVLLESLGSASDDNVTSDGDLQPHDAQGLDCAVHTEGFSLGVKRPTEL